MSCCSGGWEIVADEETASYYRSVKGDFSQRLKDGVIKRDGKNIFRMTEKGNCAFLNEERLCDIYSHLGEDRMCLVCKTYPRQFYQVGNLKFCSLATSCPEVTRRILERKEARQLSSENRKLFLESRDASFHAFVAGLDILQQEGFSFSERLAFLLLFLCQFDGLNKVNRDPSGVVGIFTKKEIYSQLLNEMPIYQRDSASKIRAFMVVFPALLQANYDQPEWRRCRALIKEMARLDIQSFMEVFERMERGKPGRELEQFLIYRYEADFLHRAGREGHFEMVAREVILYSVFLSYLSLSEMLQGHVCTKEERILVYSLCSRIDHGNRKKEELDGVLRKDGFLQIETLLQLIS